jgi:YD repeat-containing protein
MKCQLNRPDPNRLPRNNDHTHWFCYSYNTPANTPVNWVPVSNDYTVKVNDCIVKGEVIGGRPDLPNNTWITAQAIISGNGSNQLVPISGGSGSIKFFNCPAGYTPNESTNKCEAPPSSLCPANYAYDHASNKCVADADIQVSYATGCSAPYNVWNLTYFDGLGRTIQKANSSEGSNYVILRAYFDTMGRQFLATGPYFSANYVYPQAEPAAYPWTQTTFDYFSNPVKIESPAAEAPGGKATTVIEYNGLATTVTDPDLKKKKETKDYLGRLIAVKEYGDNSAEYNTTYAYNVAGNLLNVTDSLGRSTVIAYDTLGRKLNMTDPNMGHWQYAYDGNSNLKTQTDAKGQVTHFDYDALNRVLRKSYSTGDPAVIYTYDPSILNGTGRLGSVTNGLVTTTYGSYDYAGRVLAQTEVIGGAPVSNGYVTSTGYDGLGRPVTITYPDGYTVTNSYYPGTSLLKSVVGSDGTSANVSQYTPSGKMGRIDYGNGAAVLYVYDAWSERLQSISAASQNGNTLILSRSYLYSPAGNITQIADYKKGAELNLPGGALVFNYQYDSMHRLKSESSTGNTYPAQNYSYDPTGNILAKTHVNNGVAYSLAYEYDPAHIHAVKAINGNQFVYDANGNMTTGYDMTGATPSQRYQGKEDWAAGYHVVHRAAF